MRPHPNHYYGPRAVNLTSVNGTTVQATASTRDPGLVGITVVVCIVILVCVMGVLYTRYSERLNAWYRARRDPNATPDLESGPATNVVAQQQARWYQRLLRRSNRGPNLEVGNASADCTGLFDVSLDEPAPARTRYDAKWFENNRRNRRQAAQHAANQRPAAAGPNEHSPNPHHW